MEFDMRAVLKKLAVPSAAVAVALATQARSGE